MIALMPREEREKLPVMILPEETGGGAHTGLSSGAGEANCLRCEAFRPEPQRSGNLQVDPEIHLPSPGMDVDVACYYNAVSTNSGPFGYGRQLSANLTAQASGSPTIVTLTRANGALVSFQDDGMGN